MGYMQVIYGFFMGNLPFTGILQVIQGLLIFTSTEFSYENVFFSLIKTFKNSKMTRVHSQIIAEIEAEECIEVVERGPVGQAPGSATFCSNAW